MPGCTGDAGTFSVNYGWENNPAEAALGIRVVAPGGMTAEATDALARHGKYSLLLTEDPEFGTPEAYIAHVKNLETGDQVTVTVFINPYSDGLAKGRLWAHYSTDSDPDTVLLNADGNYQYAEMWTWNSLSFTWTVPAGYTALVPKIRLFSLGQNYLFVDDVTVTVPKHAVVVLPGGKSSFNCASNAGCSNTCFGKSCDFWVETMGQQLPTLEIQYG